MTFWDQSDYQKEDIPSKYLPEIEEDIYSETEEEIYEEDYKEP